MSLTTNSRATANGVGNSTLTPKTLNNTELTAAILNRETPVDNTTWQSLIDRWSYDLYSRRPGPAMLRDGDIKPTDLDLAAFLSALADRNAVVQIPHYVSRRQVGAKSTKVEVNLSPDFRRGRITGVTSNATVFSFCLRLEDMSVLVASLDGGKLGAPRNFMVLDVDGDWHEGWDQIDFVPTEKENAFIQEFQLAIGGDLVFDTFVHPNRWTSFYGQDYFVTKTAIQRAEDETRFLRAELKALSFLQPPIAYHGAPTIGGNADSKDPRPTRDVGVTAFEAEVDVKFAGDFPSVAHNKAAYIEAKEREKYLQWTVLPRLRFATRATEFAFNRHLTVHGLNSMPSWRKGAKWEPGFRLPRSRTDWNRLIGVGGDGDDNALRFRTWTKIEKVTGR